MKVSMAVERATEKVLDVIAAHLNHNHKVTIIDEGAYVINHTNETLIFKIEEVVKYLADTTTRTLQILFVRNGTPVINENYDCEDIILVSILNNLHNVVEAMIEDDYNENTKTVEPKENAV